MKKGFTLIELLAVIVILAIIALIAVPIIINIISDTKEQSELRSAELYVDAVDLAVMNKNLTTKLTDATCTVLSNGNLDCNGIIVEVLVNKTKPTEGTITIQNRRVVRVEGLKIGNNTYQTDSSGKIVLIIEPAEVQLVTLLAGSTLPDDYSGDLPESYGSKYRIYVNDTTPLNFYVIGENEDGTTNLILERNICSNGSYATEENLCQVSWITPEDYTEAGGTPIIVGTDVGVSVTVPSTDKGPVTAMNYLNQATSSWTNITYDYPDYDDEGENFTDFEITGHARLPYGSEIQTFSPTGSNRFLYNYLYLSYDLSDPSGPMPSIQTNYIMGLSGYWLFASSSSTDASVTKASGDVEGELISFPNGIRPVITLEL